MEFDLNGRRLCCMSRRQVSGTMHMSPGSHARLRMRQARDGQADGR